MKKQLTVGELVKELSKMDQNKKVEVALKPVGQTAASLNSIIDAKEYDNAVVLERD